MIKGEEDKKQTGQAGLFCYETLTWKQNSARAGEKSEKLDSTLLSQCNKCERKLADKSGDKSADTVDTHIQWFGSIGDVCLKRCQLKLPQMPSKKTPVTLNCNCIFLIFQTQNVSSLQICFKALEHLASKIQKSRM